MIVKKAQDVTAEDISLPGAEKARVRWLLHEPDGAPNFYLRMFHLDPGGCTPRHEHDWEHEIYVLEGSGEILSPEGPKEFSAGTCVLVKPGEVHQISNTGSGALTFLCLVPRGSG
jgi:quercetin dioxygenase-like cupin family protein